MFRIRNVIPQAPDPAGPRRSPGASALGAARDPGRARGRELKARDQVPPVRAPGGLLALRHAVEEATAGPLLTALLHVHGLRVAGGPALRDAQAARVTRALILLGATVGIDLLLAVGLLVQRHSATRGQRARRARRRRLGATASQQRDPERARAREGSCDARPFRCDHREIVAEVAPRVCARRTPSAFACVFGAEGACRPAKARAPACRAEDRLQAATSGAPLRPAHREVGQALDEADDVIADL